MEEFSKTTRRLIWITIIAATVAICVNDYTPAGMRTVAAAYLTVMAMATITMLSLFRDYLHERRQHSKESAE